MSADGCHLPRFSLGECIVWEESSHDLHGCERLDNPVEERHPNPTRASMTIESLGDWLLQSNVRIHRQLADNASDVLQEAWRGTAGIGLAAEREMALTSDSHELSSVIPVAIVCYL